MINAVAMPSLCKLLAFTYVAYESLSTEWRHI